jgi:tetratricopeptide (TPR) repeat protein
MGQPVVVEEEESVDSACAYFYYLWGKSAENDGKYEEALEAYEKVLLCDRNSTHVMRDLAFLFIKMGRNEEGALWLHKIIEKNPSDIETRSILARLYTGMGEVNEAVQVYNAILAIRQDPQTLLMLGKLYARNRQYEQAQEVLMRLLEQDGDSYLAHYYLGQLYVELRLFDKAITSYENALQLNWSSRLALELAELLEQEKMTEQAIVVYRRMIEEDPLDERPRLRLANLYLSMEQTDEALGVLREFRELSEDRRKTDFVISRLLMVKGDYEGAIGVLKEMLEGEPDLVTSRYMLALAYYQNGDLSAAQRELNKIPPEAHEFENSILLRVKIFQDQGNSSEAITLLENMVNNASTEKMQFYLVLASLYHEEGETDKAKNLLDNALTEYKDNVDFVFEYGLLLERIGEHQKAMAMMQDVLVLEPHHSAALNYIGYSWADQGTNLNEALKYIEEAVSLRPDDGYIRDSLGWVYFKLGDLERARLELERSLELVDSDPTIFEHLGDVYRQEKNLDKAREVYEKALELIKDEGKKEGVRQKLRDISEGI